MGRKRAWDGKGSDRRENRFHRSGRHGQAHGEQPAEGRAIRDGLQPFSGRGRRTRPGRGGGGAIAARRGRALRCRHHDAPGLAGRPVGPLRSGRHSGGSDPGEGRRGHELHRPRRRPRALRPRRGARLRHAGRPRERRAGEGGKGDPVHHGRGQGGGLRARPGRPGPDGQEPPCRPERGGAGDEARKPDDRRGEHRGGGGGTGLCQTGRRRPGAGVPGHPGRAGRQPVPGGQGAPNAGGALRAGVPHRTAREGPEQRAGGRAGTARLHAPGLAGDGDDAEPHGARLRPARPWSPGQVLLDCDDDDVPESDRIV